MDSPEPRAPAGPAPDVAASTGSHALLKMARMSELVLRSVEAWQRTTARSVANRPGFQGLATADFDLTRRSPCSLPAPDQAAMRVVLNGTFFTQDALTSTLTAASLGNVVSVVLRTVPSTVWWPARSLRRAGAALVFVACCSRIVSRLHRSYMRGRSSCLPCFGYASAWQAMASGPLPGLFQSSFRAELFAVRCILRVATASSAPFRIWTDCLG